MTVVAGLFCTVCGLTSRSEAYQASHHCRAGGIHTRVLELGGRAAMAELNEREAAQFGPGGMAHLLLQRRQRDVASEVQR